MTFQSMFGRTTSAFSVARHRLATRTIALMALALICAQLSRVYLVIPADAYTCSMAGHSHGAAFDEHRHDHDSDEVSGVFALRNQDDGQTYMQHCKETLDGLGLVLVQPFQLPVAASLPMLAAALTAHPAEPPSALDNYIPPLFQPPKSVL